MRLYRLIFIFIFSLTAQASFAVNNDEILPPDQVFKVSATALSSDKLEVSFDITEGYSLYKKHFRFESKTSQIQLGEAVYPEGKIKHDEVLGDLLHYPNSIKVVVPVTNPSGTTSMQLLVHYQGCADKIGICYPPQEKLLDISLPVAEPKSTANPLQQLLKNTAKFSLGGAQNELLPAEQAFQLTATVKDANTLSLHWELAKGYYLYREKIHFELSSSGGTRLGEYTIPRGEPVEDEAFGKVEIFHTELIFDVPLVRANIPAQNITLQASYQGCADRGVCYPPMHKSIELALPEATENINIATVEPAAEPALSEQDQIVKSLKNDSIVITLISFFGFGLLLSLTPCIFPMIPILSGIIVGHGHRISTARAFFLSLSYVVASAFTYTVFGILAALFGSNLQTTFQQPWIIALFSGLFVVLSLSMFGFYNLELPNALKTKLHNSSIRHQDGSLWGAAIMGALSALIVGPCVAAPLAGALIFIGKTGNVFLGGSALFALGLGMGVPLLLLGASAGKLLPKAGDWLNSTKAVFGVIMLAVAVWMLGRILPPPVTLLLWATLLIIPAIYLSAIDPLPQNSTGWRKLWKGLGLMMLAYGLLLLIGFSMGNSNPLKPLQGIAAGGAQAQEQADEQGLKFEKIKSLQELEAKLKLASAHHQRVMLDFYADWCISCKEIETYTFTDPNVKQALQGFVLLQADVTQNSDEDKALLAKYQLIGPPAILFFDTERNELSAQRVIGFQDAETFVKTVRLTK